MRGIETHFVDVVDVGGNQLKLVVADTPVTRRHRRMTFLLTGKASQIAVKVQIGGERDPMDEDGRWLPTVLLSMTDLSHDDYHGRRSFSVHLHQKFDGVHPADILRALALSLTKAANMAENMFPKEEPPGLAGKPEGD